MFSSLRHRHRANWLNLVRVPLNPQLCLLQGSTSNSIHCCVAVLGPAHTTASDKLFVDAAKEEGRESDEGSNGSTTSILTSQHKNWTGEESMQDAVLRMLVDKYKPLRSGHIRTSDQKLKDSPPEIWRSSVSEVGGLDPIHPLQDGSPLLPGIEGHKPWHTTFKVPSHTVASIKVGNFASSSTASDAGPDGGSERTRRKAESETAKPRHQAHRLSRAREATLDYRLGLRGSRNGPSFSPTNPVSLKGWNSLVEDRIEKARLSGQFDKVKGRGKPIARLIEEEHNPFIAREEFLLNRIVQRNRAAPPWIEVQMELEVAVNAFRKTLRQSWSRHAIRMMTISQPATCLSLSTAMALRDREWEQRERSYHDVAIAELNSLVRKYNTLAPYAVRRSCYTLDTELARAYEDCGEEIMREVKQRSEGAICPEEKCMSVDDAGFPSVWAHVLLWIRSWFTREQ